MVLKNQILVFKKSADTLFKQKDYTSATILYFKTWFVLQDFILKIGESPKDHNVRFRMLESYFPKTYIELDKEFSTYRDTYSKITDFETCKRIKQKVEKEIDTYKISKDL